MKYKNAGNLQTGSLAYPLNYRKVGSSKEHTLVFVHGLMGYWRNFYSISQAFKQDYSCILYDQRGHGQSFHKEPYTIEALAEDLKKLLEHLNIAKPVTLLGHSLGAYVSCYFAYQQPDWLNQLILVDASPWPKKEKAEEMSQLLRLLPCRFESQSHAKDFFKKGVTEGCFSLTMARFLRANLEKKEQKPRFLFNKEGLLQLLLSVRAVDYSPILSSLQKDTLYLRGEHSEHFLRSEMEQLTQLNPRIKVAQIPDSAHWLHVEQPEYFVQSLKNFLKKRAF